MVKKYSELPLQDWKKMELKNIDYLAKWDYREDQWEDMKTLIERMSDEGKEELIRVLLQIKTATLTHNIQLLHSQFEIKVER